MAGCLASGYRVAHGACKRLETVAVIKNTRVKRWHAKLYCISLYYTYNLQLTAAFTALPQSGSRWFMPMAARLVPYRGNQELSLIHI